MKTLTVNEATELGFKTFHYGANTFVPVKLPYDATMRLMKELYNDATMRLMKELYNDADAMKQWKKELAKQ